MTSLLYPSSGIARFHLKHITVSLCVHVMIQWHSNVREKVARTYSVTLIMLDNNKAAQGHLDTMIEKITEVTQTASAVAKNATIRQS